ncbi:MAG: AraC family transcriptional regulator [Oscillospiraceae bacterium]|nr:AraC family transcriptional regulator [Oscillospiraceae bacterium]
MQNKMKVNLIKDFELYEFGHTIQSLDKSIFPEGYTYYELEALNFVTLEFNRFDDDCYIEPLNEKGLLYINRNDDIRVYLVDKPICIKSGVVFLFIASRGGLQFSLVAKGVADMITVDTPVELPPFRKGMEVEMVHQVSYVECTAKKRINTMQHILYEIIYVDKGGLIFRFDNSVHQISSGQIFIVDKNTRYFLDSDNENTAFISIVFNTKTILYLPLLNRALTGDLKIFQHFKNIIRENEATNQFYLDVILSELNLLLIELTRIMESDSNSKNVFTNNFSSIVRKVEIVQKVIEYIDDNIMSGDITVDEIGKRFFLTGSYLSRIFKLETGKTISQYKRDKRLEISKKMLIEDNLTVSEVSEKMNYCSIHYFSSEFKKKYGFPPSEYANKIK